MPSCDAPQAAALDQGDRRQRQTDHDERYDRGDRADRKQRRRSDVGRHRPDLERQCVLAARRQHRSRELIVGQGEAEQRDADDARQQDRQRHLARPLPGGGAKIARGLLVGAVEAADHREHHQQAERQCPGQLRAERRRSSSRSPAQHLENKARRPGRRTGRASPGWRSPCRTPRRRRRTAGGSRDPRIDRKARR